MLDDLKTQLQRAVNFPSPPVLGMRIIELMSEADVDVADVAAVISKDPSMTAKILRVANSGLYAKRRKSENLRQAIVALGLNAASTIALSFSLVDHFKKAKGTGIDYSLYWRRALLSASAARAFGSLQRAGAVEEIFLGALLQDLGVLAIDRVQPEFYAALPWQASHADIVSYEMRALQGDHATLGAWLLRNWQLPERLCAIIESSHVPMRWAATTPVGAAARCLELGADFAELLLLGVPAETKLKEFSDRCVACLGVDVDCIQQILVSVMRSIPEIEQFFDISLVGPDLAALLLAQAHELMSTRTLQAMEQVNTLEERSRDLAAYTAALEDKSRRDPLTQVFNRGYLDETARKEFRNASVGRWPLSIIFADLDRFKAINDAHGHAAGDLVLQATARILVEVTRDSDMVARYGGEEFVILLPGTSSESAQLVCQRLLARLRTSEHAIGPTTLRATASLGLATHSVSTAFASVEELVRAADRCVYAAKRLGRDRFVVHGLAEDAARS
jgi:diguanylate cyclase (GGDEF)-like protein